MWRMCKTYAPMLWKTKGSLEACGRRGKLIHYLCGNFSCLLDGDEKLLTGNPAQKGLVVIHTGCG
jgi:hypothetical protein